MPLTPEQQAEIEALAQQVIAMQASSTASDLAATAAAAAAAAAKQTFSELRSRLYAQMQASGVTPGPFVFGEFTFTPGDNLGMYLLTSSPSLATILQGGTTP
ncbi:MAG: hypothetical protein IJI03_12460 [Rudaea sp.]|nr:hypothetical protein [Rudaea sp.]